MFRKIIVAVVLVFTGAMSSGQTTELTIENPGSKESRGVLLQAAFLCRGEPVRLHEGKQVRGWRNFTVTCPSGRSGKFSCKFGNEIEFIDFGGGEVPMTNNMSEVSHTPACLRGEVSQSQEDQMKQAINNSCLGQTLTKEDKTSFANIYNSALGGSQKTSPAKNQKATSPQYTETPPTKLDGSSPYANKFATMQKNAESGSAFDQALLASSYENGSRGAPVDKEKAAEYYFRAQHSSPENPLFMYWVGRVYDKGIGLPFDPREAARWYIEAAMRGYGGGAYAMGFLIGKTKQDKVEAMKWFLIAEILATKVELEKISTQNEKLKGRLSKPELSAAKAMAKDWIKEVKNKFKKYN